MLLSCNKINVSQICDEKEKRESSSHVAERNIYYKEKEKSQSSYISNTQNWNRHVSIRGNSKNYIS